MQPRAYIGERREAANFDLILKRLGVNIELRNFFVACICGYEARLDFLDQERTCVCGRRLSISPPVKAYLLARQKESLAIRENAKKATESGHVVACLRDGSSSMTIRLHMPTEVPPGMRCIAIAERTYALLLEGDLFHLEDVSESFANALGSFVDTHSSALWDQQ